MGRQIGWTMKTSFPLTLTFISILIIIFFDKITKLSFYKKIGDEEYLQIYQPIYAKYKKELFPKFCFLETNRLSQKNYSK